MTMNILTVQLILSSSLELKKIQSVILCCTVEQILYVIGNNPAYKNPRAGLFLQQTNKLNKMRITDNKKQGNT